MTTQLIQDLVSWCASLPPAAAFFFSLPFLVAAAGLLAHAWRSRAGDGAASAGSRQFSGRLRFGLGHGHEPVGERENQGRAKHSRRYQ
jgi:hypothetical protein